MSIRTREGMMRHTTARRTINKVARATAIPKAANVMQLLKKNGLTNKFQVQDCTDRGMKMGKPMQGSFQIFNPEEIPVSGHCFSLEVMKEDRLYAGKSVGSLHWTFFYSQWNSDLSDWIQSSTLESQSKLWMSEL